MYSGVQWSTVELVAYGESVEFSGVWFIQWSTVKYSEVQ